MKIQSMKKLFFILSFFLPIVVSAQPWYKSSPSDYMWKNVGNADFSNGGVYFTCLAFNPINGQPYVAYNDWNDENKASMMTYDGTDWLYVGNPGFSAWVTWYESLAFSPAGQPYVAFKDDQFQPWGRATVMKFDGTNWVNVGNAGFSAGGSWCTSLAFSPSGEPYVAYGDYGNSYKATVMKFDGVSWITVGNAGFSAGLADYTSLAFSQSGEPYVAYSDSGNLWKATVMKYDGSNWVNVGSDGFSPGVADYTSLAFSPSGEPFVAFSDRSISRKAVVMKFDGTNWLYLGNAGFSAGGAYHQSLAFGPSGQPYVAFVDSSNSHKATLMKFDGTNWVNIGNSGFSAGTANYPSLAFSQSGEPYVAFEDEVSNNGATVMKYDSVYVGIKNQQNEGLLIYPNPTSKDITIDFNSNKNDLKYIDVYNTNGEAVLKTQSFQDRITLNVEAFPEGVYIVRFRTESSNWAGKFCKKD
jgi:hypothetical protein